jgi:hypothetical protein
MLRCPAERQNLIAEDAAATKLLRIIAFLIILAMVAEFHVGERLGNSCCCAMEK